jgi:hypothetical protein
VSELKPLSLDFPNFNTSLCDLLLQGCLSDGSRLAIRDGTRGILIHHRVQPFVNSILDQVKERYRASLASLRIHYESEGCTFDRQGLVFNRGERAFPNFKQLLFELLTQGRLASGEPMTALNDEAYIFLNPDMVSFVDTILMDVKSSDETLIAAIRIQLKEKDGCKFPAH